MTALPTQALPTQPTAARRRAADSVSPCLSALVAAMIALGVYLLTLAPDLTWANGATDGGELITASITGGIPHPPGYPTYVIIGKLFSLIPFGTVAFRYNLLSAVSAAAAVGLLAAAIGVYHGRRVSAPTATAVALCFGFIPLVWSQATVAEVYSLNLLFVAAFLLAWSRRGATGWSGVWLGLAITTHLTSLLLLPLLFIGRREDRARVAGGMLVGLSPLLLLPLLALGDSPVMWGQPTDLHGWWWLVSGQLYSANLQLPNAERVLALLRALALGPVAYLFIGKGRIATPSAIEEPSFAHTRHSTLALATVATLYAAFALCYATADTAVLLLPGLMLIALLAAPFASRLGWALWLLPVLLVPVAYPSRNLSDDHQPRVLATTLLHDAPPGAILLTPGDRTIFTLWYFHHVEGQRPDLIPVDANLFAFDWYRERLRVRYPEIFMPEQDNLDLFEQQNAHRRPVCRVGLVSRPLQPDGTPAAVVPDNAPYLYCIEGSY